MKYLIDTDWIIDHFNRVQPVTSKLEELTPEGLAVSIISLAELHEGIYSSRNPMESERVLREFLVPELTVHGVDEEICRIFGRERRRLRRQGRMIGDFDLLIASTCLCYDLVLLSNNRSHLELVSGLPIISV